MKTKLLIILLCLSLKSISQNLYNYDSSLLFGKYLYNSNQLEIAVREFERCVFLKPGDHESFLYLFKIHRKSNSFVKAIDSFQRFNGKMSLDEMDVAFGTEYFKLLAQNGKYQEAADFLDKNLLFKSNLDYRYSVLLLKKEWKLASNFQNSVNAPLNKVLSDINKQGLSLKKKKPLIAGLFSALVPGTGKVYAGRWKDGLISFVMTSSAAFISIRGFQNDPQKIYPWIMGTLAIGYYSGNIYGSSQAAIKFNQIKEDELARKTLDFILIGN